MAPTKTAKTSSGPSLKKVKGENFYRDAKKVKRLKMLTGGKPIRDKDGKIVQAAEFQKGEDETKPGRVQADRRWFGNTRVISQTALDHFRSSLSTRKHDPYSVLLRRNKLPMALLDDAANPNLRKRSHIVETEPFSETFGPKAQRKKPRIEAGTFEELGKLGATAYEEAERAADSKGLPEGADFGFNVPDVPTHADIIEPIYAKGTSRRIYGELYKVIDSSDVVLHILDARDPLGTMCESVLEYIRKEKAHKQVVLIINKCDLVPNWVTARYIQHLTPRYPTLAFHASPNHAFGKGALIQLLRQFSQLHSDKKQISVGLIGYPNVGKSSVINTIKSSKVCRVAPVPGETKVWQYITLTRRIYLIDCPGIVPASANDSTTAIVLKGVVRVEALATPSEHIPELLKRVKPLYLSRTYGVPVPPSGEFDADSLLDTLARQKGRLLKGGEPDLDGVAKVLLSDWTRGRIPYFVSPPERPQELNEREERERRIAKAKGRQVVEAKAPEKELRIVKQNLGSIMQKNSFVGDDVRPMDEVEGQEEDEDEDEVEEGSQEEDEGEPEEELAWGDVFGEDAQAPPAGSAQSEEEGEEWGGVVDDVDAEASVSDSDGSSGPAVKESRMKTNKRKATNFYSDANVKNKNRKKAAHMKALRAQGRRS